MKNHFDRFNYNKLSLQLYIVSINNKRSEIKLEAEIRNPCLENYAAKSEQCLVVEQRFSRGEKARGRRGRGWEQRAFVARSRICRTLCHVKTREEGSSGRWANRYLHSTYDDVNAEKRVDEEGPLRTNGPTKAFRLQGAASFLSSSLSRAFLKDEDETERERERERRLGSMYVS